MKAIFINRDGSVFVLDIPSHYSITNGTEPVQYRVPVHHLPTVRPTSANVAECRTYTRERCKLGARSFNIFVEGDSWSYEALETGEKLIDLLIAAVETVNVWEKKRD